MNDFLLWWLYIVTALLGQGDPKQQAKVLELTYGPGPALIIVLLIPLITIPLAGAQPFFGYSVWRGEPGSPAIRLGYAFLTGATLAFFPYLHYWNLLGFCF